MTNSSFWGSFFLERIYFIYVNVAVLIWFKWIPWKFLMSSGAGCNFVGNVQFILWKLEFGYTEFHHGWKHCGRAKWPALFVHFCTMIIKSTWFHHICAINRKFWWGEGLWLLSGFFFRGIPWSALYLYSAQILCIVLRINAENWLTHGLLRPWLKKTSNNCCYFHDGPLAILSWPSILQKPSGCQE